MDLEFFNTQQAAEAYGVSASWLAKLRVTGAGCRYSKLGRRVLYRQSDFADWVASQVRTSTADPGPAVGGGERAA
jgi:hypothetical protein